MSNGNNACPSTETSPLFPTDDDSTAGSDVISVTSRLLEEAEHPWPSTFERSIALLASPIINADRVNLVTKSPKPGATPLGLANRRFLKQESSTFHDEDFQKLAKVQSLDFHSTRTGAISPPVRQSADEARRAQERKTAEAKAYRQKLLQQQAEKDEEGGIMSPGYRREKQSARIHKQKRKEGSDEATATFSQCVFNMSNILMGVGMLGLPYVFRSAGWIGGFFVTLAFGLITWRTSILIGRELNGDPRPTSYFDDSPFKSPLIPGSSHLARMLRPIKSFPDIAREAFGEKGCFVLAFVLYFELFSCLCIFFVTLGDHMHSLFPMITQQWHMIIVSVILTIPTAVLRTPKLLSYLSMVGTIATVCVVSTVFLSSLLEGDISERVAEADGIEDATPYHIMWNTSGLPLALGLVAYTFSGHAIVPSIYSSMARPQEFERMIDTAFLIVLTACLVVAVSGYHMFGSVVEDQITLSLEANSSAGLAMKCLTWLMILTAFSKFTLTMFPLALGMEEIIAPFVSNENAMEVASSLIKLVLIVLSLAVAIFVPSFSMLCALVGLICTMIVSAIFPAAAHLKLFGPKLSLGEKVLDWTFVVFGSFVAVVGTIATLQGDFDI